jgi:serine/threonine-protein kinase
MIGSRLGKWILDRELGHGGMGHVYLAHDADQPDNRAAVKVLAAELTANAGAVHRFQREIHVLNTLTHPNVVRFYESGTHEGLLYYVMEYVEGEDYAEILEERGRLPWAEVLDLAIQICGALRHAHQHGFIHRDIKPSNLLRGKDGQVKLTDFGVAHVFADKHLTRAGAVVGTAEYLSPEQAEGKPATHKSDLYSLGCVLYTLLCGRNPFHGDNVVELLHKHRYALFDPARKIVPDLPLEFDEILCQLLEKDPEKRPPDAGVLRRRLEAMRRRQEHRSDHTVDEVITQQTQLGDTLLAVDDGPARGEGPATLMSRLLRRELESQIHGGAVRRFFNKPAVIVIGFFLCFGILVWTFWPPNPEKEFRAGAALLDSPDRDGWDAGWERINKVRDKLANSPHAADVERYERQYREYQADKNPARRPDHLSEAQWFYYEGLRQHRLGRTNEAKQTWSDLVLAFQGVASEQIWVQRAEDQLAKEEQPPDPQPPDSLSKALENARSMEPQEAAKVYEALERCYRGEPAILEEIRRAR